MQFQLSLSVLVLVAAVLPSTVVLAQTTNFGASCSSIVVFQSGSNFNLEADCRTNNGGTVTEVIGLNSCLANINGQLICRVNGNAMNSCFDCQNSGTELNCFCSNGSGNVNAAIDLNNCVGNQNGVLTCS